MPGVTTLQAQEKAPIHMTINGIRCSITGCKILSVDDWHKYKEGYAVLNGSRDGWKTGATLAIVLGDDPDVLQQVKDLCLLRCQGGE